MSIGTFPLDQRRAEVTERPQQFVGRDSATVSSNEILLISLPLVEYELTHHLLLNVKHTETGKILISEGSTNVYGVGDTLDEAVEDFSNMLFDIFEELQESESVLSRPLKDQLSFLSAILRKND